MGHRTRCELCFSAWRSEETSDPVRMPSFELLCVHSGQTRRRCCAKMHLQNAFAVMPLKKNDDSRVSEEIRNEVEETV